MDPDIHSRNGPGMEIKKLLKKLVRVSEMPPKLRNLRVSKKVGFLIIALGCTFCYMFSPELVNKC